jgi:5,6-dimethylbenzimidazole synthase
MASRLDLKDVVYFEKWQDTKNVGWNQIQEMIKTNLYYA